MERNKSTLPSELHDELAKKFKKRLKKARDDRQAEDQEHDWTPKYIAEQIRWGQKAVASWFDNDTLSIPHAVILYNLAKLFNKSVGWLLEIDDPIHVATNRGEAIVTISDEKYDEARREVVKIADRKLWILLRSGITQAAHDPFIGSFKKAVSENKPAIRLLICDPDNIAITAMVAARLGYHDPSGRGLLRVAEEIKGTIELINNIATDANVETAPEITTLHYLAPTLGYIANPDPDESSGMAVMMVSGFNPANLRDSLTIRADKTQQSDIFNYFVDNFERLRRFGQQQKQPLHETQPD